MEVRIERGGSSAKETEADFSPTDDVGRLGDRIIQILNDSPGTSYRGEVRFNFYELGSTSTRYGSFTRTVHHVGPAAAPDVDPNMSGDAVMWKSIAVFLWGILKESMGAQAAFAKAFGDMASAGATVQLNFARATGRAVDPPSPNAAGRQDLLTGLFKVAEAAAGRDAKGAVAAAKEAFAPAPPPTGAGEVPSFGAASTPTHPTDPLSPPASAPSSGGYTRADAEKWARENPDEAKAMVKEAILASGKPGASVVASMID